MHYINDPLGQTHSSASSNQYSRLNFALFCEIDKSGDRRTDGRTDNTFENSDHYWPGLWSTSWINTFIPASCLV